MDEYAMSKLFDMASELVFCVIERASERGALWHLPRHVRIRSGRRRERDPKRSFALSLDLDVASAFRLACARRSEDQDPQAIKCS